MRPYIKPHLIVPAAAVLQTWRKRIPHPDCVLKKHPAYKDFTLTVPWLVAQNPQAFAFWVPCEPAFYDRDPEAAQCT
jgi:hypothetical protein